jgi:DNA ligase-1
MHDMYVDQGYEGIIIRRNAEYEYFRSKNLLKLKHWIDEEFEIIDVLEGIGNRSGMMGKLVLKMKNGETFEANAKGTYAYYKELLINKKDYIGKMATLKYQNLTPAGKPRFGTIIAIRDYE